MTPPKLARTLRPRNAKNGVDRICNKNIKPEVLPKNFNSKVNVENNHNSKRKRKHLTVQHDTITKKEADEKELKSQWVPPFWEKVLENIRGMRQKHSAPVDTMGAECCANLNVSDEVFRFQTLVSLMLSSQTKDNVTFAAMNRLKDHGLTVESILETSNEKLGELIYPVGFWRRKVEYLKKATQILVEEYNSDIPNTIEGLCKLPGVGPKMAYLAMSIAWKQTVGIGVDTHVHRITNRLHWVKKQASTPEETRRGLEEWLPRELWTEINFLLVGFGQTICQPVKPKCSNCLNSNMCPYAKEQLGQRMGVSLN